jgi:hypothetical protein
MLYREIIYVCSEIHTKHINTLCGQSVELLNVDYWALEGYKLNTLAVTTIRGPIRMSQIPVTAHNFVASFSRAKQLISRVISFLSYKFLAVETHTIPLS